MEIEKLSVDGTLIDCHAHATVFTSSVPGTILKPPFTKRWVPGFLRRQLAISPDDPVPEDTYLDGLAATVRESKRVSQAVLLGSDGIYDSDGLLDTKRTRFMIDNDFILNRTGRYPELLPGVSINPARADALEELERCRKRGAVLVKILPNVQEFDPADQLYVPFYRRMAEMNMPLVAHCGYEFTLPARNQAVGNPARLKTALESGVTVILAHGGSTGLFIWEKYFLTVKKMASTYPHLYLDMSALTLPSRSRMLFKLRRSPELAARCLFGTDYPIPVYTCSFLLSITLGRLRKIRQEKNYFDRYCLILDELGIELRTDLNQKLFVSQ